MLLLLKLAAATALLGLGNAASNFTTVPHGTAIKGDYTGYLRPQLHLSPPQGFMSYPSGLFIFNNTFHAYYLYNPLDTVAAQTYWGHATSPDGFTWTNQPVALFPAGSTDSIGVGSIVVDVNNTSGFFPGQANGVVAIYTHTTSSTSSLEIAYSTDGGQTFTNYTRNPVLGGSSSSLGDPKVTRHNATQSWIMSVADSSSSSVSFYTSSDLKTWTFGSKFTPGGVLGTKFGSPNLIAIPMNGTNELMYILVTSTASGSPLGGSTAQYFPGSFNGTHFTPVDGAVRFAHFGKDFTATQFFYGTDDTAQPIGLGWASDWLYAESTPTGLESWRGAMSAPCVFSLANVTSQGYDLMATTYDLTSYKTQILAQVTSLGNSVVLEDYFYLQSNAVYLEVNITGLPLADLTGSLNITFASSLTGETLRVGFFLGGSSPFWIDRGALKGFDNPFFYDKFSTTLAPSQGSWRMALLLDRSILEVFLGAGAKVATASYFPSARLDQVTVKALDTPDGAVTRVTIFGLGGFI